MNQMMHIWPMEPVTGPRMTVYAARLERASDPVLELQYKVPNEFTHAVTDAGDSFLVGALFKAMKKAAPIHVHGRVSPSLLRNLTEFQAAWKHFRPDLYTPVEISADREAEGDHQAPESYLTAFSGGVDASFTLYRHCKKLCGRFARPIGGAVMVHGFDIPFAQEATFTRASARAQAITDDLGVPLIRVATNWRVITPEEDWEHMHGSALAAVLLLFQRTYRGALIASGSPYSKISIVWGSSPIFDARLGGVPFTIEHDGAAFERYQKIEVMSQWPAGRRNVRICFEGDDLSVNCGVCYKCLRSILLFRAVGAGLPECFAQDVDDQFIRNWHRRFLAPNAGTSIGEILRVARLYGTEGSWSIALKATLEDHERIMRQPMWWRKLRETVALRTRMRRLLGRGRQGGQELQVGGPGPSARCSPKVT